MWHCELIYSPLISLCASACKNHANPKTNACILLHLRAIFIADGYHYESGGDGFLATMAVLPKMGPVVLLAVKLFLSFIVPVRQDTATFTAPGEQDGVGGEGSKVMAETTRGEGADLNLGRKTIHAAHVCYSSMSPTYTRRF